MNNFQAINEHLLNDNIEKSSEILKLLIDEFGNDILHNLLMNNILPEPLSRDFNEDVLYTFSKVIINIEGDINPKIYRNFVQYIISTKELKEKVEYINKNLNELDFFDNNPTKQLQILTIFMEDQGRLMNKNIIKLYKDKKIATPNEALSLELEDDITGNKKSYIDNYENLIDILDVIFRFIFWKYDEFEGKSFKCCPYNDPSLQKLSILAEQRKFIENLWQDIKYFNWRLLSKKDKNLNVYYPGNPDLYKYMKAGSYRKLLYNYELGNQIQELIKSNNFFEALNSINIKIDEKSGNWDSIKNIKEINEVLKYPHPEEFMLSEHFYTLYKKEINDFEFGYSGKKISGDLLMSTWKLFYVLAVIYQNYSWEIVNSDEKNKQIYNILIPFLKKEKAIELLNKCTGYSKQKCSDAITLFQFNPDHALLDLGLQPLIETKNDKLIIIPTLCKNLNLIRLFETHLLQWDIKLNGFNFEEEIENTLREIDISVSSKKISFMASDGRNIEYDIIFWFKDHLFIIEAKCLKQPYSSKDKYNVKKDIDKGIDQLKRRKKVVLSDWNLIKNNVDIDLPQNSPSEKKIVPLLITNLFTFTGLEIDNILVSDYKALFKYLKDPRIISVEYNKNESIKKVIGHIWEDNEPTPKGLLEYLKRPLALKNILEDLELKHNILPPLNNEETTISALTYLLDNFDITDLKI